MPTADPPSRIMPFAPATGKSVAVNLLVTLPFLGFFLVQLLHHQPWRDELNAWGIAVASHTLPALYHYLHYEGHPSLWYLLLWVGTHWTHSPIGMMYIEAVVGIGIYLVIGLLSPFSIPEKLLLFLSYFVSFEYTVMSRMYGLCFFLVLLYAVVRTRRPDRIILLACLLGLIANMDIIGTLLSGALALEYIAAVLFATPRQPEIGKRQVWTASAVYAALLLFCAASLWPAKDISTRSTGGMFSVAWSLKHLRHVIIGYTSVSFFPISLEFPDHFWAANPHAHHAHSVFYMLAPPFVVITVYLLFRRQKNLLLLLGSTAVGCILFFHLIYAFPTVRHFGIAFMALVVALWIQRYENPAIPRLSLLLLGVNAVAGILAVYGQWHRPFSNASATAQWIRSQNLQDTPLLGTKDTSVVGVAEELDRPIYFLDCSCTDRFLLFSSRRDGFDDTQVEQRITAAKQQLPESGAILILTRPLTETEVHALAENALSPVQLAQFTGAEVDEENFFLYRLIKAV